jgi:hypothetical protein
MPRTKKQRYAPILISTFFPLILLHSTASAPKRESDAMATAT